MQRAGEALPLLRAGAFRRLAALAESTIALAALRHGAQPQAGAAARRATQLLQDDGEDHRTEAIVLLRCSVVQHATGQPTIAQETLHTALPHALDTTRDRNELADTLQTHAWYLHQCDPATAAALLGAGDRLRHRPIPDPVRVIRDHTIAGLTRLLGGHTCTTLLQAGAAFSQDDLLKLSVKLHGSHKIQSV